METPTTPKCPECGGNLITRERIRDGHQFIGCENFPTCKYTQGTKRKYKGTHRKEYELVYGEPIPRGCVIHHINGRSITKEDNERSNLLMVTRAQHERIHKLAREMWIKKDWNLEMTTRYFIAHYLTKGESDIIIVEEGQMKAYMETFKKDK